MGSHDQRDMPVPAVPGPHFVLIQAQLRLGFLKAAFDGPTGTGGQANSAKEQVTGAKAK